MHRPINPWIDCVFKEIFGEDENRDLLLDLVNAVLEPSLTLRSVELTNPVAPEEFIGDNFSVVDVKARDEQGRTIQLELQLQVRRMLSERMLYAWSDLYHLQLQRGERHFQLRPVISIWILGERLFPAEPAWHHVFELRAGPVRLSDHLRIDVLELPKWPGQGNPRLVRWLRFLREASTWEALPRELDDPLLRRAMAVLQRFSEKEIAYLRYQDRMNAIREQNAWVEEMAFRKAEIDALEATLAEKTALMEARAAELEAKTAEFEARAAELEAKTAEFEARAAEHEAKTAEAEARAAGLEAKAAELEAKTVEADAKTAEAEAKTAEAEARAAEVHARAAEVDAKAAELESRLAEHRTRAAAHETRLDEKLRGLDDKLGALEATTAAMAREREQLQRWLRLAGLDPEGG